MQIQLEAHGRDERHALVEAAVEAGAWLGKGAPEPRIGSSATDRSMSAAADQHIEVDLASAGPNDGR